MKTLMKFACAKAILFLLSTSVCAQTVNTSTLNKTVFWSQKTPSQAACQTRYCLAYTTIFCSAGSPSCINSDPTELKLTCPQPAGGSCAYHIGVEAAIFVGDLAYLNTVTGYYYFLVDGSSPKPSGNSFVEWGCAGPGSGTGSGCINPTVFASSYVSTVATVTNTLYYQAHSIQVAAACVGVYGCQVSVNRALATIDVYKQ